MNFLQKQVAAFEAKKAADRQRKAEIWQDMLGTMPDFRGILKELGNAGMLQKDLDDNVEYKTARELRSDLALLIAKEPKNINKYTCYQLQQLNQYTRIARSLIRNEDQDYAYIEKVLRKCREFYE